MPLPLPKQPFELITYPKTDHDFVEGGSHYNPQSYKDAFERTAAKLKEFLQQLAREFACRISSRYPFEFAGLVIQPADFRCQVRGPRMS